MTDVKKFSDFFYHLGELCFKIKMVERAINVLDFTSKEGQIVNEDYFDEVVSKYPNVTKGFSMAMHRSQAEGISCYLMKDGSITVEFFNNRMKIEYIKEYSSVKELREDQASLIHHFTKKWKPY